MFITVLVTGEEKLSEMLFVELWRHLVAIKYGALVDSAYVYLTSKFKIQEKIVVRSK